MVINLPFLNSYNDEKAQVIKDGIGEDDGRVYRDGVELEKGVILTEARIRNNLDLYKKYCNFFTAYPDLYLDMIKPIDSHFNLYPFQRIFLRGALRYKRMACTGPRGLSKSFNSILAKFLVCVFRPGSKEFVCAPGKEQGVKIASEKISEIFEIWPLLHEEVEKENFSKDYVFLKLKNGAIFTVIGTTNSTRGSRSSGGLIDELRKVIRAA